MPRGAIAAAGREVAPNAHLPSAKSALLERLGKLAVERQMDFECVIWCLSIILRVC